MFLRSKNLWYSLPSWIGFAAAAVMNAMDFPSKMFKMGEPFWREPPTGIWTEWRSVNNERSTRWVSVWEINFLPDSVMSRCCGNMVLLIGGLEVETSSLWFLKNPQNLFVL